MVHSAVQASPGVPPDDRLLVGLFVGGREVGVVEVIRQRERYLIPLEAFLDASGTRLSAPPGDTSRLETPLGTVEIPPRDLRTVAGVAYLDQRFIEEMLHTPVVFDQQAFALLLDLPWSPRARAAPTEEVLTPEARPPKASLSIFQTELDYVSFEDSRELRGSTRLSGRIADGWWRARYRGDFDGDHRLEEYAWLRPLDDKLLQVGHQRVRLHPLLRGVELTGAQLAWTNQSFELFSRRREPGELLPRQTTPIATFRGLGPPTGRAELWIDDSLVERQTIGLNGIYEFLDVTLASRLSRIEVRLFERHDLTVPVAIHEEVRSLSRLLLAAGGRVHLGGLGLAGNPIDRRDTELGSEPALFYQGRFGLSQRLTVETMVERTRDRSQVLGGVVARLSPGFITSLSLGASDGEGDGEVFGYTFDLDGQRGAWRYRVTSQGKEAGFDSDTAEAFFDHNLEIGYRHSPTLDLGLVGRGRRRSGVRDAFLLPTFSWHASRRLSLRGRPNADGDYRFDLRYARPWGRLAVSLQNRTSATLSIPLTHRTQLLLGAEVGSARPDRYSTTLNWIGSGRWRPRWTAGALHADGRTGFLASADVALFSGVLARIGLDRDPSLTGLGGRDTVRLQLSLVADLAVTGGRLSGARRHSVREDRGAIAGRVRLEAPIDLPDYALRGLTVYVDGRPSRRTQSGGTFFIGDLKPGVHSVVLDTENLPIELTPVQTRFIAEVAAAAVTRVDFVVEPEFGVAGRVTDATGRSLPDIRLEIFDLEGRKLKSAETDQFGLYRIDGLPIGTYTLRLSPESFPEAPFEPPSRRIEVRDDFLFGQDLVLPVD